MATATNTSTRTRTDTSAGAGGRLPTTAGGRTPGTAGPPRPPAPPAPRRVRAAAAGARLATAVAGRSPGVVGGPNAATPSIPQLLDVDGYALVVERHDGSRERFATTDARGPTTLSVESSVNAIATVTADLPALGGDLFRWARTPVVVAHTGTRLFHGVLMSVDAQSRSSVRVSGFGRLFELTLGGMTFSASDTDGCEAINEFWRTISDRTDGRVRGYCEPPPPGERHTINSEGITVDGSPMAVAKKLHGRFGYSFVLDPADSAGVVRSFRPGTQTRAAVWRPIGDPKPKLDPTGYANHVVVRGALRDPDGPTDGPRYRGEARAPKAEAEELMGGYLPPLFPDPDPDLRSDEACQAAAVSRLAEARGRYAITGSRDITPTAVTPGYVYEVPSFDAAVPPAARPVTAIPQTVTHQLIGGEAKTTLDFSEPSGIVAQLQRARNPNLAPGGVQRQQMGLVRGMVEEDDDRPSAYAAEYPHLYSQ